jgi:hypothetical protein
MTQTHPALIVINVLITVFAILIAIVYFKSKLLHSYPYYFNILFILTILLNNLIRLIPKREEENEFEISIQCYIQGISLAVLDKYTLCLITSYSVIYYLGSFLNDFFEKNKMMIFLFLSESGFIFSLILATIFCIPGMSVNSQYCYVKNNNTTKFIIDSIVTGILWFISLFCTIRLIINLIRIKREIALVKRKAESLNYHTFRFSFNLIFNVAIFLYVILLINRKLQDLPDFTKDLYYILLSFIGEVFFTVNPEVMKEAKMLITCQKANDVGSIDSDEKECDEEMAE